MTGNSEEHHHQHNTSAKGKTRQAPTFSKKYPHENKLRNQHLSIAEAPKKPTDENKGSQDQKRSATHRGKNPARRTAVTPLQPIITQLNRKAQIRDMLW
jgi:hypothetical protein